MTTGGHQYFVERMTSLVPTFWRGYGTCFQRRPRRPTRTREALASLGIGVPPPKQQHDVTSRLSEWPPRRMQRTGDLVPRGGHGLAQPLWGTVWQCLQIGTSRTARGPRTPLPVRVHVDRGQHPEETAAPPHHSIVHSSQDMQCHPAIKKAPAIRDSAEAVALSEVSRPDNATSRP